MRDVPADQRQAQFRCVLVAIGPGGAEHVFEGECRGRLLYSPRGGGGFGYDPIFVPEGSRFTFGEMNAADKHAISHRARAFEKFARSALAPRAGT